MPKGDFSPPSIRQVIFLFATLLPNLFRYFILHVDYSNYYFLYSPFLLLRKGCFLCRGIYNIADFVGFLEKIGGSLFFLFVKRAVRQYVISTFERLYYGRRE